MRVFAERRDLKKSPREIDLRVALFDDDSALIVYDADPPPPLPRGDSGGSTSAQQPYAKAYIAYWMNYQSGELSIFGRRLHDPLDVGHALRNLRRDLGSDPSALLELDPELSRALSLAETEPGDATIWHSADDGVLDELLHPSDGDDSEHEPRPQASGPFPVTPSDDLSDAVDAPGIGSVADTGDGVSPDSDASSCPPETMGGGFRRFIPGAPKRSMSRDDIQRAVLHIVGCGGACDRCVFVGPLEYQCICNTTCCYGPVSPYPSCCWLDDFSSCCDGVCCKSAEFCCPDRSHCCENGKTCCGTQYCCPPGEICCDGECGAPGCCDLSLSTGGCETTHASCCQNHGGQWVGGEFCCPDGSHCCLNGETCCGTTGCCGIGQMCCGETECCDPQFCCDNGECCDPLPCEGCLDPGVLSGGIITVSPDPPCTGDTITFTLSGVVDESGGTKRVSCSAKQWIPPGTPTCTCTWTLTLPPDYPSPLPILTGSGCSIGVVAKVPGTYTCSFTATANRDCPPPGFSVDPKTVQTPTVTTLEWIEHLPESTPLDGCPNNGGKRIFPDKRYVIDPSADIRQLVDLRATISPVVEGCTVHFRIFDVDDPFDQNNGLMPNVSLIDGDTSGPDNRGADPGVTTGTALTDVNGRARFPVTVSMQPGNNYRGAASTVLSVLNGTTQAKADADTPPNHVVFSDILTVWRRVWLELDSMAAGSDIGYTGAIDAITNNSPHAGDGTVELDVPDINDDGRLEGGTMTVAGTGNTYTIMDNVDAFVDDDYTMTTPVAAADLAMNATVVDDDTAVLPKTPDANITVLNAKYKNAYIEYFENSATRDNNNAFVATMPDSTDQIAVVGMQNADVVPGEGLWCVHLVTAYQCHHAADGTAQSNVDGDPDAIYHVHGSTSTLGDQTLTMAIALVGGKNVALFFLETNLDYISQLGAGYWPGHILTTLPFKEPRTLGHEIGHVFGISAHTSGTLVGPWDGGDYDFDAVQLLQVRSGTELATD